MHKRPTRLVRGSAPSNCQRGVFPMLNVVELRVESPGRNQFVVGSPFFQLIVMHDKNSVGAEDRREMVWGCKVTR